MAISTPAIIRLYPITKVFDNRKEYNTQNGSTFIFPAILEHPKFILKIFRKFSRAILVGISSALLDELGFGRNVEGGDSNELYEIRIIGRNRDEIAEIIKEIRLAVHNKVQDVYINITISPLLRYVQVGRGKYEGIIGLSGNYMGLQIDR